MQKYLSDLITKTTNYNGYRKLHLKVPDSNKTNGKNDETFLCISNSVNMVN
jgi:hypothetical protein